MTKIIFLITYKVTQKFNISYLCKRMMKQKLFSVLLCSALCISAAAQTNYSIPFPKPLRTSRDTVSVMIIGDVMMHTRQLQHDHEPFLKHISHRMSAADFCIANMEFSLGGEPYSGYPAFSAPDWYAEYVARCGADVFLLANNHILDRGAKGLLRTLSTYSAIADTTRVRFTGASADSASLRNSNPLLIRRRGISIALLNFTYGTNGIKVGAPWPKVNYINRDEIHSAIVSAREQGADFVVALPHWGEEYKLQHSKSQEDLARWLVDEGVDAIVGAHPHVVQDTTHISGVPVIYSIGNAVSNMSAQNTRLELAVTLKFERDDADGSVRMFEPELDFMWCTLPGMLTRSYATIFIKEWASREGDWLTHSDYLNMMQTLQRVKLQTGIKE